MAIWGRLQAFVFGGAIARAGSEAVTPVLEPVRQHAWQKNTLRVLDPATAARLVAQAKLSLGEAEEESSRSGYNANRLQALVHLAQTAPGVAEALTLYRRKEIDCEQLYHAFAKGQIESQYWLGLEALAAVLLTPAEIATAIQQGHLPNEGVLPGIGPNVTLPPGFHQATAPDGLAPSEVPLTQIDLDGVEQASEQGTDFDQLRVLANLAGLPPGPELLLTMWNRGEITEEAVNAGIREGHMKTKWASAFKRMRFAVLSPQEAASARLRTWITAKESYEIGAQHGYTHEQMDLMFLNRGRPATPRQLWIGWARKLKGPRGVPVEYEDHAKAIAISDIRPEYAELLWEARYNYPALFQLNRLVQSGAITPALAAKWAGYNLEAPEVIDALSTYWRSIHNQHGKQATKAELDDEYQAGFATEQEFRAALAKLGYTGAAQDLEVQLGDARRLKKWREAAVTAIGKSYLAHAIDDTAAISELAEAGVTGEAAQMQLRWWALERRVTIRELTDAQLVKAYGKGIITEAIALERLQELGFTAADAQIRLTEG